MERCPQHRKRMASAASVRGGRRLLTWRRAHGRAKEEARREAAARDRRHGSPAAVAASGAGGCDGAERERVHEEGKRSFSFVEGYGSG
jgi:hypothetical protein